MGYLYHDEFARALESPSDIHEHVPVFAYLCVALDAQIVVELGVRHGISTRGWLYGVEQTGGHLWSVDRDAQMSPMLESDRWTFLHGDDLDPEIAAEIPDEIDILFIDTMHTYDQTFAELLLYGGLVRHGGMIVLHDTTVEEPALSGMTLDIDYPVRRAIRDYLRDSDTYRELANCNGLGIIGVT